MDLSNLFVIFAVAVCAIAAAKKYKGGWALNKFLDQKPKIYYIIAAVLFIIGIAVRLIELGSLPGGINQDGAMGAVDAYALSMHGTDRFGTQFPVQFYAWGIGQMSVLLSYLMVPFIKLFGLNEVTVILPIALASIAALWVMFKFTESVFGKGAALIVLAFLVINPWHIMQSRWTIDCNIFPHFVLFSLYFLYLGLTKKGWYLYLSMAFFGLSMYGYGIAFYFVPILLLTLCTYLLIKKHLTIKTAAICALTYLVVAWPIFALMIINFFKLPTLKFGFITIQYFPDTIRTNDILFFSKDIFQQLLLNIQALANTAFLQKPDSPWNTINEYGPYYLFSLPFTIVGFVYIINKFKKSEKSKKLGIYIVIAWLFASILSGLITNNVLVNRMNMIFYPLILITGIGIYFVAVKLSKIKILYILIAAVYVFSFVNFDLAYFGYHGKELGDSFFVGIGTAIEKAESYDPDVIYVSTYGKGMQIAELMTMFYSKIDSRYYQGKKEEYSKKTGKKQLPYGQRYQYYDMSQIRPEAKPGVAYVYFKDEEQYFDANLFNITYYNNYCLAIPK